MTDNLVERLRAPVQGFSAGIPWSLHLRAWDAYAKRYGRSQTAERLAERGGFGTRELDVFVPGWRDEVSEITRLQEALAAAEAALEPFARRAFQFDGLDDEWFCTPSVQIKHLRAAARCLPNKEDRNG